uniref:G-protein coupled receptors family 3 profile domain-containing protein n=1 Tax=Romanomermis culicivorax TaxID=13658 RepID=A0A915JTD1_ROMCU
MYRNVCYKWLKRHNRRKNVLNSTFIDSKRLLCPQMNPINGSLLYQYMRKVRFVDFFGQEIYFDEHGDPPARYDILNYQGPEKGYVKIGEWKQYEIRDKNRNVSGNRIKMGTRLSVDKKLLIWHNNVSAATYVFQSICSEPCKVGEYKKIQDALQCCWNCIPCLPHEYVLNENACKSCPLGSWPTSDRLACYELVVEYMRWNSAESLMAMILAVVGIAATTYTTVVFAKYNNTPVVKATTRELSYIILAGFFMCYATTFVIIAKPTTVGCYIMRILPNTAFAMIYGALLTKTNRIARILSGSKKRIMTKKPRFMSTTAQLVITALVVGLELSITTAILIYEPANALHDYSMAMRVELVCKTSTLSFLAPYGFDFFLVASCTFYAVKTRNLPENFNEAKFIGFTMYTTCVIWLAFCSIYFGSNNKGITMSLSFTLSASVALVLLFFPKLYIIIVKPERNVRSSYTTTKTIRCHFGKGVKDPLSQSVRSTTDSGIELASVRHRRTMTKESLHPQMSRHIDGDSRSE